MNYRLAVAIGIPLMLSPMMARAQSWPVYQTGLLTRPGDLAKMTANGQVKDAGGVLGDPLTGLGVSPFAITDYNGPGININTAATSGSHNSLSLGHDDYGNAVIVVTGGNCSFNVNGAVGPCVTSVAGSFSRGPSPPVDNGEGVAEGYWWDDSSVSPEALRRCNVAQCSTTYVSDEWVTLATFGAGGLTITGIAGGTVSDAAITGSTLTGNAISGGTIAGSAISGGTISGAAITGSTMPWIDLIPAQSFPGSFGSTPSNFGQINVGAYPLAGEIQAGVLQSITSKMVVPGSYTQEPWPNSNFAGYLDNQNNAVGSSAVIYFGVALADANNALSEGTNIVLSNTSPLNWRSGVGQGNNFAVLGGAEYDVNIYKVGSATPTGSVRAVSFGGASEVSPTGDSYMLYGFPLGTGIPWSIGFYTEDGAAAVGVDLGTLGTGNGMASQPMLFRSRTSGGSNNTISISADENSNLLFGSAATLTPAGELGLGGAPTNDLDVQFPTANMRLSSTTGNNAAYYIASNNGGVGLSYFGNESSAGGAIFTGGTAFATVIGSFGNEPVEIATDGIVRMTISAAGQVNFAVQPSATGSGDKTMCMTAGGDVRLSTTTCGS